MRVSLAAGALALWLAACASPAAPAGELRFTGIERKDDPAYIGQQQYNALDPGLVVIPDAETAAAQADLFGETAREAFDRVDWRTQFVVAVFQGWQSGSGYGVTVERVVSFPTVVRIYAVFETPEGDPSGGVTSPYHLIAVRRPSAPVEGLSFELVVGEQIRLTATAVAP